MIDMRIRRKVRVAWSNMRARCTQPSHHLFPRYGGRGIAVCDRWNRFENFLADMGFPADSSLSLDRIDTNGNYEPRNCRWATWREQERNRRNNTVVRAFGEVKCVSEWVLDARCSVADKTLRQRLEKGWEPERAITQAPIRGRASRAEVARA